MRGRDRGAQDLLDHGAFRTVFQPIFGTHTGTVVAVEALTRFADDAPSSPSKRFADAHVAGCGVDLELATLQRALEAATTLPRGVVLSVNLSPAALIDPRAMGLLGERQVPDVAVEVTEHAPLTGYPALLGVREELRTMGVRVAVDDVGVNATSLRHLERLRPDQVKMDISLTRGLQTSRRCLMLAGYLVGRARQQGASVVAEGIESPAQLSAWQDLGVDAVQGFLLACPMPLDDALAAATLASRVARPTVAV
jgi:EAL domain-containing protein (putative c-di-GMP-specific phosphodiesterase class I)